MRSCSRPFRKLRPELSKYAPKMLTLMIDTEKIREVIGSGGKVIQKICADCGVKIDIEDDGHVFVSGVDMDRLPPCGTDH